MTLTATAAPARSLTPSTVPSGAGNGSPASTGLPTAPLLDGTPEDLAKVLDDLRSYYERYIVFGLEGQSTALALWAMYTHSFALGQPYSFVPYVLITSAEPLSGKSTILELIAKVVHNPLDAQDVTPALIGRTVGGRTLILDEIDGVYNGREAEAESKAQDLRTILNSGFKKNGTYQRLVHTKNGDFEAKTWSTFGPKILAGIGRRVPDTIQTRSIRIRLARKTDEAPAEKARERFLDREAIPLKARMQVAAALIGELAFLDMPTELGHRDQDLWEPLFALAHKAGGDWSERAHAAAIALSHAEPVMSLGMRLLADIRDLFRDHTDFIPTADIIGTPAENSRYADTSATGLCAIEESPWATLSRGRPITPVKVAELLSEYDIKPSRQLSGRHGYGPRGYFQTDFITAWKAYLDPADKDSADSADKADKVAAEDQGDPHD